MSTVSPTGQAFELKGSLFTLLVLVLKSTDLELIESELVEQASQFPAGFAEVPVVLDLEMTGRERIEFGPLLALLRRFRLAPVGVGHAATREQEAEAVAAGLGLMPGSRWIGRPVPASLRQAPADEPADDEEEAALAPEEVEGPAPAAPGGAPRAPARLVTRPVRAGQQVYARGGDLVVLSVVNPGADVIADGNIHVYAPLRGRALAGAQGDAGARIFCQAMRAELVSIAGHYKIFEESHPSAVRDRPAQVYLEGGELKVVPL